MQTGWNFTDTEGRSHVVGLYHGDDSGHLMLHCDNRVVQVDFSVKESRLYSFFVNEDLVEINLIQEDEKFRYELSLNSEIRTAANLARKQRERRWAWQTAAFFIGTAGAILALIFLIRACKN